MQNLAHTTDLDSTENNWRVCRTQLVQELLTPLPRVCMVVAPASSGKTWFARELQQRYIETQAAAGHLSRGYLVNLDAGGLMVWTAERVWQRLQAELQHHFPGLGKSVPLEQLPLLSAESWQAGSKLTSVVLVLDDFHALPAAEATRTLGLCQLLLQRVPILLHFIITSRTLPTFSQFKPASQAGFVLLDKTRLKINATEIASFLTEAGYRDPAKISREIESQTRGWAGAVGMRLQQLLQQPQITSLTTTASSSTEVRLDLMAQELLRGVNQAKRTLLEAWSLPEERFSLALAKLLVHSLPQLLSQKLTNNTPELAKLAADLTEKGLLEFEPESATLQVHPVIREYFLRNIKPQRKLNLCQIAAQWYYQQGDYQSGVKLALAGNLPALASQMLDERARTLLFDGDTTPMDEAVLRLFEFPEVNYGQVPHLALVAAYNRYAVGEIDLAHTYYKIANNQWGSYPPLDALVYDDAAQSKAVLAGVNNLDPHDPADYQLLCSKALTVIGIAKLKESTGNPAGAASILEKLKAELVQTQPPQKELQNLKLYCIAVAARHLAGSLRLLSRLTESITEGNFALSLFIQLQNDYHSAATRQTLGITWRQLGNPNRAEENYEQARRYWTKAGKLRQLTITLNSLAVGLSNSGRIDEAIRVFEEAVQTAQTARYDLMMPYLLVGVGDAFLSKRDREQALYYFNRAGAEAKNQNSTELIAYAHLGIARLWRRAGDGVRARQAVLAALDAAGNGTQRDLAAATIENGAYQTLFSQPELALAQLEGGLALATKIDDSQSAALAHFWLAYLHYRTGQPKIAIENMRRAIAFCQNLGYAEFLHEEARELPELSEFLRLEMPDQFSGFLARSANYALGEPPPADLLEFRGFGKARVMRQSIEIPSVSRKARELIFLLADQRAPISGERLNELMWGETRLAGQGLGSGFYSTVTHARRLLGGADTVRAVGGSYTLTVLYRYDAAEFETLLEQARQINSPAERVPVLIKLLELTKGDFLADSDSEWVRLRRQDLIQKNNEALQMLYQSYLSLHDYENAASALGRLVRAELFDEEILRNYVRLLVRLRSNTIALNFLRRRMDDLHYEGVEPEDATQALYDEIDQSRTIFRRRRA